MNFDRALYPCAAVSAAAKAQKVTVDKRKLLQESGGETKVPQLFKDPSAPPFDQIQIN